MSAPSAAATATTATATASGSAAPPPDFEITQATPQNERKEFLSSKDVDRQQEIAEEDDVEADFHNAEQDLPHDNLSDTQQQPEASNTEQQQPEAPNTQQQHDSQDTITQQPEATATPYLPTKEEQNNNSNNNNNSSGDENTKEQSSRNSGVSSNDDRSSVSFANSGYQRESNECTEFCIEFLTCFGLLDACCPSNGEGCITNAATICGNILVACCKC